MTPDRRTHGPDGVQDTKPDVLVSAVTPTDLRSIHRHPLFSPSALAVCWPSLAAAGRSRSGGDDPHFVSVACKYCRTVHYVG
jgi:hypothetical protein